MADGVWLVLTLPLADRVPLPLMLALGTGEASTLPLALDDGEEVKEGDALLLRLGETGMFPDTEALLLALGVERRELDVLPLGD